MFVSFFFRKKTEVQIAEQELPQALIFCETLCCDRLWHQSVCWAVRRGEKAKKKKKKKGKRQLIFYLFTAQQNQKVVASKPHASRPYPGAVAAWVSKGCADSSEGEKRQHPKAKQVKGTNDVGAKCSCLRSPLLLFGLLSPGDLSRTS